MTIVARAGEELARSISRRGFLNKTAALMFTTAAGLAASPRALATGSCPNSSEPCECDPPFNRYCTAWNLSYCNGSACRSPCSYTSSYGYSDYCWCSHSCSHTGTGTGYYVCCDCSCPEGDCG